MPESEATTTSLDRHRLQRILAPWSAGGDLSTVWIEDPSGMIIAGRSSGHDGGGSGRRIHADIVVSGALIARVVATAGPTSEADLGPAMVALAAAIAELEVETRRRGSAERTLRELRASGAAGALGTDAAELAKGRRQQRSILSLIPPDIPGYDLATHYAPAREIGGDFFELFRLRRRGRPLGIVIADVTGKGLDAALLMAFSRAVMHSALDAARGPADALERTNHVLAEERRGTLFVTALCAVLDLPTGRIRISSAGHEPPWLVPGDGGPIRPVGDPGVLVGMFASLGVGEVETTLEPGDAMLFYTDGVTDAIGPTGQRFGDDRLLATIAAARAGSAQDLVAAVRADVEAFQGATEPADDVTMVVVGRHRRARTDD